MTIERDLLLSSFFDGEVDSDETRRALAAVASDPAAADALRELAAIRDLVAAMPRPRPPDLSAPVVERIAADARRPRPWKTWGPYLGRGLATAAVAASLGLVVFLGAEQRSRLVPEPAGSVSARPRNSAATRPTERLATLPPARSASPRPATATPPAAVPPPERVDAPAPVVAAAEAEAQSDRPAPRSDQPIGLQQLWEADEPRRDFSVGSAPGEGTAEAVATLLGLSAHRDFYRLSIPGGPLGGDAPAPTVAFAARLDPNEYKTLRGRLESKFPNRLTISESEPETAGLLADLGRATAVPATPAADVSFPQTQQAFRVRSAAAESRPDEDAPTAPPDAPSLPPTPPDPTGPSVVLIWVVAGSK